MGLGSPRGSARGPRPAARAPGPRASARNVQEELHPGARLPQALIGKAVDQLPAFWWARHPRPVLTGSEELGGHTLCPRPQRRASQAFLGGCWSPVARASSQPLLLGPHGGVGW